MGFWITYDSWDGHHTFHTKDGEMGLPYIDEKKYQAVAFVKTVQDNFEGLTKKEITAAKIARESQVMIVHQY